MLKGRKMIKVLGICGSLRAGSLNRSAMRLAGEVMPQGMSLEELDWAQVPPFNADVLAAGMPQAVQAARDKVMRADAVLIATPEYNFSVPGMLKNLLDWLSRGDDQPFNGKPVAILSAAAGPLGGARMQYDLRRIMLFVNAEVLVKPEVFIGSAQTKFSVQGECTDELTRSFARAQMNSFATFVGGRRRMRSVQ